MALIILAGAWVAGLLLAWFAWPGPGLALPLVIGAAPLVPLALALHRRPHFAVALGALALLLLGCARAALWLPTSAADPLGPLRGQAHLRGSVADEPRLHGALASFTVQVEAAGGPAGWQPAEGGVRVLTRLAARQALPPTRRAPARPCPPSKTPYWW